MQPLFPKVEGISHRFVKVNGMHMHLAEAGGGEPLLMIHGWPQHWYMWRFWYQGVIAIPLLGRWIISIHRSFRIAYLLA